MEMHEIVTHSMHENKHYVLKHMLPAFDHNGRHIIRINA